jgi:hypothetical protein
MEEDFPVLSVLVVFLRQGQDESLWDSTKRSVLLSRPGVETLDISPAEVASAVESTAAESLVFVRQGALLLPDYFQAMTTTLEHYGSDFVACRGVSLSGESAAVRRAGEEGYLLEQVLVRLWVCREVGASKSPEELISATLGGYRGSEVPHFLVMRL